MFFRFDPQRMLCLVSMALNEAYEPTSETLKIHEKTRDLNKRMDDFMNKIKPDIKELEELVALQNKQAKPKQQP